jgi:leucyl aminopeptidase
VEIRLSAESVAESGGDAVVVAVVEKAAPSGAAAAADERLGGLIGRLVAAGEIKGKQSEVTILHTQGKLPAARVAVVGLGRAEDADLLALRRAMGAAARALRDRGCRRVGVTCHQALPGTARAEHCMRAALEGAYVGLYRGGERKSGQELPEELEELWLLGMAEGPQEAAAAVVRTARVVGEATNYARRLVNLPANQVTPRSLAEEAAEVAKRTGLEVEVLEPPQLRELGLGGLLAVGEGSEQPPRLIVLRHHRKRTGPRVAFVGKGLTFDSGGISIKPTDGMHLMKSDMAGAAAVLAAMGAAAELKLEVDLLGVIPAAENLPSGRAYRPGDVLTALGGRTIEVISTDAEGRLVLADALGYARQLGASHLVDVATLTGACVVALGHVAAGVMGNDNEFVEAVLDAGERAGERMWRLPLFPEYRRQLDSKIADLKNVGGRPAGTITGGWFLREFAGDTAWVHIDIAGTAWSEQDEPHQVEGATGAGTRTLIALAERMAGGTG